MPIRLCVVQACFDFFARSLCQSKVYTTTVETPFVGSEPSMVYTLSGPMVYTLVPCLENRNLLKLRSPSLLLSIFPERQ